MRRRSLRFVHRVAVCLLLAGSAFADDRPRAPFDAMRWVGDTVEVRVDASGWVRLEAIGTLTTDTILNYCREQYGDRARKRFREDLVEVLTGLGAPPGETVSLRVRDIATNALRTLDEVAMTAERRQNLWQQAQQSEPKRADPRARTISRQAAREDLEQLDKRLTDQWSYLKRHPVDIRGNLETLARDLPEQVRVADLASDIVRLLAPAGDGHARVERWEGYLPVGYLPFLVAPFGERLVAFQPTRDAFVSETHPYLVALDGRPVADWLEAARPFIPAGSPQLVEQRATRLLRHVAFLRAQLGLPARDGVRVTLADQDGARQQVELALAEEKPLFGVWPRRANERIENFGYIRVARMDRSQPSAIRAALEGFDSTDGLIVDVRGNLGGERSALQTIWPLLVPAESPPAIVNLAQYRKAQRFRPTHLAKRALYVPDYRGWRPDDVLAMDAFLATWQPEWQPPVIEFSFWHFMILRGAPHPRESYTRPVVLLVDEVCFSATDIFVAALKTLPNVTVVGMPTGGGSGYARPGKLANSEIDVLLSSMVSYQPDGRLYDGNGVEPDVRVAPTAAYFIGGEDVQLNAALDLLRKHAQSAE